MQRLPNPPLVPSSQSSGGETHSNALAQSAPGSMPVTPMPDPSLNIVHLEANQGLPVDTSPDMTHRPLLNADGSAHTPADVAFPEGGGWKQATSSAKGWKQL